MLDPTLNALVCQTVKALSCRCPLPIPGNVLARAQTFRSVALL